MDIRELTAESERREAVPILQQLWGDATRPEILDWTGEDDYHLFGQFVDGELVGVAGVLVRQVLHHDRHAWLYDLVVDEAHRGAGHGTALVEFVEDWAREQDCEHVALASPLAKEGVHEYYEDLDYEKWGYVVEKEL
ncbi:GNAT family N-acetyltransferase [Haloarchaeobius sp. HME9146]|uniref:GNAT family N-acetyltransferase n=1 Tax=Haloarchaeobius sp. HME9146 TaxID=2978732 RepID=UPI0021C01798|nr:GNAT family N-acetyltransferase [Haloarchaeobius sp. HME9146]MCT9094944.1 GNAT family N-acetyltransferase [Haloarchaeobius sp. HME9146]